MDKLLVICGPTATGKTSLALHLSKSLNAEIISADSRQVYQGLDIGTGKDLPKNAKFQMTNDKLGFYVINGVQVWGYDLVSAKEEFSVAEYEKIARKMISDIRKRRKLPILVGGTGLYIKAVVDGIATANVPRNLKLRQQLEAESVDELWKRLTSLDPIKAASMNSSDKKNPRRLIRAIEIGNWKLDNLNLAVKKSNTAKDVLFIGLHADKKYLHQRIVKRVQRRVERGVLEEIKELLSQGVSWHDQSMNTLGYKEWVEYFLGKVDKKSVIEKWIRDEKNYAKRQMTWFAKDKRINWFDIARPGWEKKVEKLVTKWHN